MTTNRLETLLCAGAMLPVLFFAGCSGEAAAAGNPLQPPLGLADAKLIVPADDPLTAAKYELGKQLFFDPRLSETGKTSCSSCHLPGKVCGARFATSRPVRRSADALVVGVAGARRPRPRYHPGPSGV